MEMVFLSVVAVIRILSIPTYLASLELQVSGLGYVTQQASRVHRSVNIFDAERSHNSPKLDRINIRGL